MLSIVITVLTQSLPQMAWCKVSPSLFVLWQCCHPAVVESHPLPTVCECQSRGTDECQIASKENRPIRLTLISKAYISYCYYIEHPFEYLKLFTNWRIPLCDLYCVCKWQKMAQICKLHEWKINDTGVDGDNT